MKQDFHPWILLTCWALITAIPHHKANAGTPQKVLDHSDVVTMYRADAATYKAYGIDVLAWGGKPTPEALKAIGDGRFFGSVGMVTEFNRYYEFAGENWEEGLCRDKDGIPIKIHWLLDHKHKGIPYYFCCTNQPVFRAYILQRVRETLKDGAMGIHIDDHLGSAATLYHGGCYCDVCRSEFADFRESLESNNKASTDFAEKQLWEVFHLKSARAFMLDIRKFVHSESGQRLPISANSCLLFHPHSTDYDALDYFSAEIDQEAKSGVLSDLPMVAYRLAEALGRPLAATASGSDWAHILSSGNDKLVRNWIAQAYASGQFFMTPHRQWCHTPEKGTHWYDGPEQLFAPLYQFIKHNAERLDSHRTLPDVVILFDMRLYRNSNRLKELSERLSGKGLSYQYAIIGDAIMEFPLNEELIGNASNILIPERTSISPALARIIKKAEANGQKVYRSDDDALEHIKSRISFVNDSDNQDFRCYVRQSDEQVVIHIVNRHPASSSSSSELQIDLSSLNLMGSIRAEVFDFPDKKPTSKMLNNNILHLEAPSLWSMVVLPTLN